MVAKRYSVVTVRELKKIYGKRLEITNEGKGSHKTIYVDGNKITTIKCHGGSTEVARKVIDKIEKALGE